MTACSLLDPATLPFAGWPVTIPIAIPGSISPDHGAGPSWDHPSTKQHEAQHTLRLPAQTEQPHLPLHLLLHCKHKRLFMLKYYCCSWQ